jgi:hypothetical protein
MEIADRKPVGLLALSVQHGVVVVRVLTWNYFQNKSHFTDRYALHTDSFSAIHKKTYIQARIHSKYWVQYFCYIKQGD